ncbi:MAG: hypothetical protein ACR2KZ_06000 [Segetibacter sp.]
MFTSHFTNNNGCVNALSINEFITRTFSSIEISGVFYDIVIIGSGAGGGTLLHKLKDLGKRILERGTFLPRKKENRSSVAVFQKERYHTTNIFPLPRISRYS